MCLQFVYAGETSAVTLLPICFAGSCVAGKAEFSLPSAALQLRGEANSWEASPGINITSIYQQNRYTTMERPWQEEEEEEKKIEVGDLFHISGTDMHQIASWDLAWAYTKWSRCGLGFVVLNILLVDTGGIQANASGHKHTLRRNSDNFFPNAAKNNNIWAGITCWNNAAFLIWFRSLC